MNSLEKTLSKMHYEDQIKFIGSYHKKKELPMKFINVLVDDYVSKEKIMDAYDLIIETKNDEKLELLKEKFDKYSDEMIEKFEKIGNYYLAKNYAIKFKKFDRLLFIYEKTNPSFKRYLEAEMLEESGLIEEAEDIFFNINPDSLEEVMQAYYNLGMKYMALEMLEKTSRHFKTYKEAKELEDKGDNEKAQILYSSLNMDPDLSNLASVNYQLGLKKEAIDIFEKNKELSKAIRIAMELNDGKKLLSLYEKCEDYSLAGVIAEKLGMGKKAIEFYKKTNDPSFYLKAAKISDKMGSIYETLELYLLSGDAKTAIKYAKSKKLINEEIKIYEDLGKIDEAIKAAHKNNMPEKEIYLCEKKGDYKKALDIAIKNRIQEKSFYLMKKINNIQ